MLRRLDCVLEPTKAKVLEKHAALKDSKIKEPEPILNKVAGHAFHNTSKLNFLKLKGEPDKAAQNLSHYIKSFSSKARQIFESIVGDKVHLPPVLFQPMASDDVASGIAPVTATGNSMSARTSFPSIFFDRCAVSAPRASKNSVQSTARSRGTARNPRRSGKSGSSGSRR